jgi:hypothetical protein
MRVAVEPPAKGRNIMRYIAVALAATFLLGSLAIGTGTADAKNRTGRWCLVGIDNSTDSACFKTLRQCKASKTGGGDTCHRR